MPTSRIRTTDGAERIVHADRMLTDSLHTTAQARRHGAWCVVPTTAGASVTRQVGDLEGCGTWVPELPSKTLGVREI